MLGMDIKESFFRESEKLVREIECNLLLLEEQPDDIEVIRNVFRPFHTIKGNAGMAGESDLQSLSQKAESVLDEVRQGRRTLSPLMLQILFETIDLIREVVIQRSAEAFLTPIADLQNRIDQVLQGEDDTESTRELVAETATFTIPAIPKEKCFELIKTISELDRIIQAIRYHRDFTAFLHPAFEAVLKTSLIVETERGLADLHRRLEYLELYLTSLNRAVTFYDREAWRLLDILRTDIVTEIQPILNRSLNISTFYINPDQPARELADQLRSAAAAGGERYVVILNRSDVPTREELSALFELHQEFAPYLAFVQRSLGQKRYWRDTGMLLPDSPQIWSSEWQAIAGELTPDNATY
jgi:HPt (histidine-containing phosphotransfer) domain-containing protein